MANYVWDDPANDSWTGRFPLNVIGGGEWRNQVLQPGLWSPPTLPVIALALPPRPVLFVSHRSVDVAQAKRIAYLANQAGFDYWLDVFDPTLQRLLQTTGALFAQQRAYAIALVVDMALLNCTHLLAAITPNTQGSWWVPYEFGRAQDATLMWPACSWLDSATPRTGIGEFLELRPVHHGEADIIAWLQSEFLLWTLRHGQPPPPPPWTPPIPNPL